MRSVFDARRPGLIHLDGLTQRVDILGYIGKMILRRKMQSAFYTPQRCAKAFREPLSMRKPLKSIGIIQDKRAGIFSGDNCPATDLVSAAFLD
tara:strand:- start:83 stop:361 length:279 start_codon:yes stop_codon:yes gene_type:complete